MAERMIPGFVGKIPSQGDFVHRRLPWQFIECWDAWMQEGMHRARERLGAQWLERYLVAPVWRFVLTEGTCAQDAWVGIWFPSVDRVGRHFPLTIAVPLPRQQAHPVLLLELDAWLTAVEETALNALDPHLSLDQLDTSLKALPCSLPEDTPLPMPTTHAGPVDVHLLDASAATSQLAELLSVGPVHGRSTSYWHTWGTEHVPPTYLISPRLLDKDYFTACLDGDWRKVGLAPQDLACPET